MNCLSYDKILNFQNWILTKIFYLDINIEKNDSNIKNFNVNNIITEQPYKETM